MVIPRSYSENVLLLFRLLSNNIDVGLVQQHICIAFLSFKTRESLLHLALYVLWKDKAISCLPNLLKLKTLKINLHEFSWVFDL